MSAEDGTLTAQEPMNPLYTVNPADLPSLPLDERKALRIPRLSTLSWPETPSCTSASRSTSGRGGRTMHHRAQ